MTENNGAGVLTGEEVMALGRRTLTLPSGGKVVIGKLPIDVLAEILGGIPDVSALATVDEGGAAEAMKRPEARKTLKSMEAILLAGVLDPELHRSHREGATVRDFDLDDQLKMFTSILELSNYTKRAGAEVLPLSRTAG